MQRAAPSRIVTGVFRALAGDGTSGIRRAVAATAVAVLGLVSIPLLLIAFLAPLLLFGHVVGPMLPVSGAHPAVSWVAVWIVVATFLAISTGAVLLSRRRTRAPQEELDGASDPPTGAAAERVTRTKTRKEVVTPFPRRILPVVVEVVIYLGVALLLMWPLTLHLASAFAGWRDAQYYTWLNWEVGQMLRHGDLALSIPTIVWPYGIDLRLIDGQLPTLIGGLWNVVAGPYLAQNLGLMTGTLLNLWAGRRLGRLFSDRREVWVLSAVAFATGPAIVARLVVHFTMYYAFAGALLIEEAVIVARGDRPIRPIRLGVLLFIAFLSGIYVLIFGSIAFALIVLTSVGRLSAFPRVLWRGAAGLGIALVLVSPFLADRLSEDRADREIGYNTVRLGNTIVAEADALSIVAQPSSSTLSLPGAARLRSHFRSTTIVQESTIFPGFLLLGGLAGLVLLRSRLRWPLLIAIFGTWLLALGSSLKLDGTFAFASHGKPVAWMPYAALVNLPGLGALRSPNRASFVLAALMTVPFALTAGWLFDRFNRVWQRAAMCVGAAALLLTNLLIPVQQGVVLGDHAVHTALQAVASRALPGQSLVEVPADCGHPWGVLFQLIHHTPIVGCDTSTAAIHWSKLALYRDSSEFAALRCHPGQIGVLTTAFVPTDQFAAADLVSLQRQLGIRFFLLDERKLQSAACAHVRDAVLPVLQHYTDLGGDSDFRVIDVGTLTGPGPSSSPAP